MANEVTFIVGNGLDLSIGLKTSYRDFYKYIKMTKPDSKNKIYNSIQNDPESWSDFELELGKYTRYIEKVSSPDRLKESQAFHDDLEELTIDLVTYLSTEEESLNKNIGFRKESFIEELPTGQKNIISPYISQALSNFNFVTFNYTNTLEKILPRRNIKILPDGILVKTIHHVHGDLSDYITLGVSDESQLSIALEGNEKNFLIKPWAIESMNDDRLNEFQRILNRSSVIVLFGTSIGKTDKYIWERLIQWLSNHPKRYIIIHKHDKTYNDNVKRIPRRRAIFITDVQDRILNSVEMEEEKKMALRNRIYVFHNTKKLFVSDKK